MEGNALAAIMYAFEKYGENSKHKEDRGGWLKLSLIDTLEKYNR